MLLKEYVAPTQANMILFFLGPVITLIFALLGYAVIPYGPALSINDMNLGIFYMLAVSSIATYGILLAGFSKFSTDYLHTNFIKGDCVRSYSSQELLVFPEKGALHMRDLSGQGCVSNIFKPIYMRNKVVNYNTHPLQNLHLSFYWKTLVPESSQRRCFIHTPPLSGVRFVDKNNSDNKEEYIKDLRSPQGERWSSLREDLFKDRIAPVIPFDRKLIIGSCLNYTDKISKAKFHKEWGSKAGIYLIEYKYYPNIYYVGRTNLFKKIFFEHFKAESLSKFHLFIRLIGIDNFNIHILELCPETNLGERETYYLQKYLPILNSLYSSTITEGVIKQTLLLKLKDLRAINKVKDSRSTLVYVYDWTEKRYKSPTNYI